jgi:hypothetical protein
MRSQSVRRAVGGLMVLASMEERAPRPRTLFTSRPRRRASSSRSEVPSRRR